MGPYYLTTSNYSSTSSLAGASVWAIVAAVLAIIGGILVYYLFVTTKQEPKGKFAKWLKSFLSFKVMWIETIIKIFYYISTIFLILVSFSLISVDFIMFLVFLVLGPIFTRLVYELILMTIMIWRNTKEIAENTKKK